MKAAFFFDTFLIKDNNDYYGMTLTYDFFKERYLNIFTSIIVSTRFKEKTEEKGNFIGYKKTNGKNVIVRPITSYKKIPDYLFKRKQMKKEIKNIIEQTDKIIIRMPSFIGIVAYNICKKLNKDYLIELVACPWDNYINHTNKLGKIIAPFMFFKTKKVIKNAKKVLYVTNNFLQKRYPTKGNAYSCSDVNLICDQKNIKNNKKTTKKDEIILLTVGNVEMKYKGHEYVIKALSLLESSTKNYKYYLVGNGDNKRLVNLAKKYDVLNRLVFLGSVNHEHVFDILKQANIYIQPSLQEGLPRALIEAMSMSLPCIGSNAGGIPELIDKKYIFKKKDYKQLASIIDNFNDKNLKEASKENYQKSLKFSKPILDKKRIKIYKSI